MRDCGERDCKVITAFQDSCGALALGKNDIGHAGRGSTLAEARQAALATCQERGGASCRIIRNTCSSGTPINSSSSSSGGTEDHYGAIAYSTATAKTGAAYNFPTREAAERQALRDCGQSDCHVEIWFRGECGALALGKNNVRAGAWSTAHASAESAALDACAQKGGQACKIIRSTCTR
jgi:serine/threonine-protein kinase